MSLVNIEELSIRFRGPVLLDGVNCRIHPGQRIGLLGRNGMGKTTTVRCLMGLLKPSSGHIHIKERNMAGAEPFDIARAGLGLVPEGRQVFPTLSVSENLRATARATGEWTEAKVYKAFPRLAQRQRNLGRELSGGEQQMLAIGRALMTNPDLLILDEATEGLAPMIRTEIWNMLAHLKADGLSILLIDKNLQELSRISDHYYVIEKGEIVWSGDSSHFDANRAEVEEYLHL